MIKKKRVEWVVEYGALRGHRRGRWWVSSTHRSRVTASRAARCGAEPDTHGMGDCRGPTCEGFICDCDGDGYDGPDHGESHDDPCPNARCYHCGWEGTFPLPLFDPKKLKGWAKTAYAAGWKPPTGWKP